MKAIKIVITMIATVVTLLGGKVIDTSIPSSHSPNQLAATHHGPLQRHHVPRAWQPPSPANQELWEKSICRGNKLITGMIRDDKAAGRLLDPPRETAQSEFSGPFPELFKKWGWDVMEGDRKNCNLSDLWGIHNVLKAIGIVAKRHDEGGHFWCWIIRHYNPQDAYDKEKIFNIEDQTYEANGRKYHMTGGYLGFAVNAKDGVIVAMDRHSVMYEGLQRVPPITSASDLPAFRSPSDIMWAQYAIQGGGSKLRYLMSISIRNMGTQAVIKRALDGKQKTLNPWPGTAFRLDQEEGQAILGTPNGRSFGFLLIQRKRELGSKFIDVVVVFECDAENKVPCLIFRTQDYAGNSVDPPIWDPAAFSVN